MHTTLAAQALTPHTAGTAKLIALLAIAAIVIFRQRLLYIALCATIILFAVAATAGIVVFARLIHGLYRHSRQDHSVALRERRMSFNDRRPRRAREMTALAPGKTGHPRAKTVRGDDSACSTQTYAERATSRAAPATAQAPGARRRPAPLDRTLG